MKLPFKPQHLKRYKDIAGLFLKYARSDLVRELQTDDLAAVPESTEAAALPEELANDLETLGPTYVKLGQLLSSRADLLPPAYLEALARLQDKVAPFPYEQVEEIVTSELGVRLSKAFASFERKHLAAASLGQVHRATLRNGRPVIVKVQRPDIRNQIAGDFEVLEEIADFFDAHTEIGRRYQFVRILAELKVSLFHELDYEREASNLTTLAENLKEYPRIHVPLPVPDYTTRAVLTMECIEGAKITALSPLVQLDIDGDALAGELFQAYLKQILVDGFFHADPHPGNIFLTEEGRIALLDLGMVGRLSGSMQEHLLKLLIALSEGDGDDAVEVVLRISETRKDFDEEEFRRRTSVLVQEQQNRTVENQQVGRALLEVTRIAADTGLYAPTELTLLGKTLLQLDQVGRILAPNFNPNAAVRENIGVITRKRMFKSGSPGKVLGSFLQMKDFVGGLPSRVNKLLDAAANAELQVQVRTPDARHLLAGFEKIANRITTGVILASLIIGAALLMQVDTPFKLFGYPGLAMLCFMAAAGGSSWLLLAILIKDYRDKTKRRS